jgi:anti-sigma regulatory factor (Ser/Thr protein kinase)
MGLTLAGEPAPPSGVLRLQHCPIAVSSARRRVRADLATLGVPEMVQDDVEVIVSELLGNSVRHARPIAGGVVLLHWHAGHDEIMIRVTDGGSGRAIEACQPALMAVSGRGLQIVERLARVWGVSEHAGGLRSVWASVSLEGSPRALRLVT